MSLGRSSVGLRGAHTDGSDDDPGYGLPAADQLVGLHQLRRPDPDLAKINRIMRNFFFVVGVQGTMHVLIIIIMARFVTGL